MKTKDTGPCQNEGCPKTYKKYKSTDPPYCSIKCYHEAKPPKPKKAASTIAKRSKKRETQEKLYSQLRKAYLAKPENKTCPITKQPSTEVHHKKGRIGDLLLDTRYWLAVSREGHRKIEENPEWAKEMGYSLSRLEKHGEEE